LPNAYFSKCKDDYGIENLPIEYNCANMHIIISEAAVSTMTSGRIFTPVDSSSKNRNKPAETAGIGLLSFRRFSLLMRTHPWAIAQNGLINRYTS